MSYDLAQGERLAAPRRRVSGWRLAAAGFVVGAILLLVVLGGAGSGIEGLGHAVAATGRSVETVVRTPDRVGPPLPGPAWRHSTANAVIFYGGYFCARRADGREVRLVLSTRELDTLTQGSSSVTGPFSTKARTRGAC